MAVGLIDDVMLALEKEKTGKVNDEGLLHETRSNHGESFEVSHTIDIEEHRLFGQREHFLSSESKNIAGYEFEMHIYPNSELEDE